jgi:DNA-binding transcriptional regulator YiaG
MLELTFAERFIAWRALRALSQPAAAFELGIHTASLNAVERGRKARLPAVAVLPVDLPTTVTRGDVVMTLVRRRMGLRQVLFAERLAVHVYRVRCWESGKPGTFPPPEVVARCLELLRAFTA